MIAGLLLAAGRSERFAGNKLVAMLNGVPIVRRSIAAVSGCEPLYVVTPVQNAAVTSALAGLPVTFIVNDRSQDGLAFSIRAGIAALRDDADAVVIALGDQPFASSDVTGRLVEEWTRTGAPAVVPRYRNGLGHPVLFSRETYPALSALTGDAGARSVLLVLGTRVVEIAIDEEIPEDVDTRDALIRLETMYGPNS